ncbi:MAG: hypothetical protein WCP34_14100, partial [Pseudomonadota bacterium]
MSGMFIAMNLQETGFIDDIAVGQRPGHNLPLLAATTLPLRTHTMQPLTSEGLRIVDDLALRHGFSPDAVTHMLFAVFNGNGTMAQFNHAEFAGSGQWMQGGMIMLGDMFNHALKGRVDSLCQAISGFLASQPGLFLRSSGLFVPDPRAHWWPSDLGLPSATGTQN